MHDHHYIPIRRNGVKTYVFRIELAEEDDGRWSAWIDALPGCTAWGYTKDEALKAIQDAAEAYVEDMLEAGEELPKEGVTTVEAPVVTITHGV
jgi:predicted RNase H-like HicB family nuclease